jgi:hypothetical protein
VQAAISIPPQLLRVVIQQDRLDTNGSLQMAVCGESNDSLPGSISYNELAHMPFA